MKFDVCIIGSGAGAGPVIYELAHAGFKIAVLEKGPWLKTEHFSKDDMTAVRRNVYFPALEDEYHVLETPGENGEWNAVPTNESARNFWNGNVVGGSSNFMSAYFHRLKPNDFKLLSTYGKIEKANIVDWPISYDELEPYYAKVETVVGVSGKVEPHQNLEPRSTPDFPFAPLPVNKIADWFVEAGQKKGYNIISASRGIISSPKGDRRSCYSSNFCGSFGCSSDGKSSARVALINDALKTNNVTIFPDSKVFHLETDDKNKIVKANYYSVEGHKRFIEADLFVVAAQAVETSRLLLMSKNNSCPNGLANNAGNVGKNLLFSGIAAGQGIIEFDKFPAEKIAQINNPQTFVNRTLVDFYEIKDAKFSTPIKGGIIDFLIEHSNPIPKAIRVKKSNGSILYGSEFKSKLLEYFTKQKKVRYEVFTDWLPNDNCFVTLADNHVDKWGDPVARIRLGYHESTKIPGEYLSNIGIEILKEMGATSVGGGTSSGPTVNLQAGGCRFGNDPKTSVLDKNCKAHEVENLYVTDGSFMPTGGSVPYTFTIYANAFRVADKILEQLKKKSG